MTRIVSFGLYQCPTCKQIHIKPNYGSINFSLPIPLDAVEFASSDIKNCQNCGAENAIKDYVYLGVCQRVNSEKPNTFKRMAIRLGIMKPIVERDVRKLYPHFNYL